MTDLDDAARMAAGRRAIAVNAARIREHNELANGAVLPPEIANRPGRADRLLALSVLCWFCGAAVGRPCLAHRRGRPECAPHLSRLEAAGAAHPSAVSVPEVPVTQLPEGD